MKTAHYLHTVRFQTTGQVDRTMLIRRVSTLTERGALRLVRKHHPDAEFAGMDVRKVPANSL